MPIYKSVTASTSAREFKCSGKGKEKEMTPEEKRKMKFEQMRKGKK